MKTIIFSGICFLASFFLLSAQDAFREADSFVSARDFASAERVLTAYAFAESTPVAKRREALFRICSYIHWANASDYGAIRRAAEKILEMNDLSLQDRRSALDCMASTYERVRDSAKAVEVRLKIVALPLTLEADIARENQALGALYLHSLRDMEKGRKYMRIAASAMISDAGKKSGLSKADLLMRVSNLYRTQVQDKVNAEKYALEAVAGYKTLLTGDPRGDAMLLLRIGNAYKAADRETEASEAFKGAAEKYVVLLESLKSKSDSEFLKEVNPRDAMMTLGMNPATVHAAFALADRVLAMTVPEAEQYRWGVINAADNICMNSGDESVRALEEKYVRAYVSAAKTPDVKAANLLRLGEIYFRKQLDLKKARGTFRYVADDPATPADKRELALLWLEMLSDAPKK